MYSAVDLYDEDQDIEQVIEGGEEVGRIHSDDEDENAGEQAEEAKEGDGEEGEEKKQEIKPKRVVRNPQPKLDAEALKGKRGLTAIEGYFQNMKFKGKGHEEEDLRKMMKTYEYWCHRLYPKFPFDECLAKLEKLGCKKNVQVYIKKIRMDMVVDEPEPVLNDSDNEEPVNNENQAETLFDNLAAQTDPTNPPDIDVALTEEQLEQIEKNREKATRLRQERLKTAQSKAQHTLAMNTQDESDTVENEAVERNTQTESETLEDESLERITQIETEPHENETEDTINELHSTELETMEPVQSQSDNIVEQIDSNEENTETNNEIEVDVDLPMEEAD